MRSKLARVLTMLIWQVGGAAPPQQRAAKAPDRTRLTAGTACLAEKYADSVGFVG